RRGAGLVCGCSRSSLATGRPALSLRFRARDMIADLQILARIAKGFLENASLTRLETLATQLNSGVASASRAECSEFTWSTKEQNEHIPIRTVPSTRYQGRPDRVNLTPLRVEITFEWKCALDDPETKAVRVKEGASVVTIVKEPADERRKVLHFDVC